MAPLDRLARFEIARHYDVAALNFFTSRAAQGPEGGALLPRRPATRAHAPRRPVWLTEVTWPAGKGRVPPPKPLWQRQWWVTDSGMATRLRELYTLAARASRKLRLRRVYWYTWSSGYESGDLFDYTGLNRYQCPGLRVDAGAPGVRRERPALAGSAARRAAAAASGSSASRIARSTTTRRAPAATTSPMLPRSMPPIANQGRSPATWAAWLTYESPAAGRPSFVGVSQTGPTLSWSASEWSAASSWAGLCVESPIRSRRADLLAHFANRQVVLPDVHAVGPRGQRQVGPVVQPEESAVLVAQGAEAGGRVHDLVVG